MKKLFIIAAMALSASSLFAQSEKGFKWAAEIGLGTEFELGARAQYNFNKYVAWDVLTAKYAYDYGKWYNLNEITIQTGVRGFSPTFGPDMKAFAALDLGYGNQFNGGGISCFATDITLGVYVWKGLYAGYGVGILSRNGSHTDHLFRIGYEF